MFVNGCLFKTMKYLTPQQIINIRPVTAAIKRILWLFTVVSVHGPTQSRFLSFLPQRRLSALGPGGLTRDRAGYEVRDVHYTSLWPYVSNRNT